MNTTIHRAIARLRANGWHSFTTNQIVRNLGVDFTANQCGWIAKFRCLETPVLLTRQAIGIQMHSFVEGQFRPGWGIDDRADFLILFPNASYSLMVRPARILEHLPVWASRHHFSNTSFEGAHSSTLWVPLEVIKHLSEATNGETYQAGRSPHRARATYASRTP